MTDEEILRNGMRILIDHLGLVEGTRFVTLVNRQRTDYTEWQRDNMLAGMSIEEISRRAMKLRETSEESELVAR
jgi:hypothetical protein